MVRKGGQLNRIESDYYNWLCDIVDPNRSYIELCRCMYETEFIYIHPRDRNRALDGEYLRYIYGNEHGFSENDICEAIEGPCSVLEMMTALCRRCEEAIMADDDLGDRTYMWFDEMLKSLGLYDQREGYFDSEEVSHKLSNFMYRRYSPNGKGGLFTVRTTADDMRKMEIWYQAMEHFNEMIFERG